MEFSIVIATKDRAHYLERALASLQSQTGSPPFEVVVADNGSTDSTASVVERYAGGGTAVRYVAAPQPNRALARNRGVEAARGRYVLFCDDDVQLPYGWIAAHAAAHRGGGDIVVNGPILNVPSYASRPGPKATNYSRAFLCTCNASLSKESFLRVGGFDESFNLYGWEDTELGLRLRGAGMHWKFAWDAYLWHVKPPQEDTLTVQSRKAVERARMARRFVFKHPSLRARLATGAHALNLLRARLLLPDWLLAVCGGLTARGNLPRWAAAILRAQFLDGVYTRELLRAFREPARHD